MTDYACRNVWDNNEPVLFVRHDHNADWQMLCGGDEHGDASEIYVLHKEHLVERDPSLRDVIDLPTGWEAERDALYASWRRAQFSVEADENF